MNKMQGIWRQLSGERTVFQQSKCYVCADTVLALSSQPFGLTFIMGKLLESIITKANCIHLENILIKDSNHAFTKSCLYYF